MNAGHLQTKHWSCTHCGGTEKYLHIILWCVSINSVQRLLASSCLAVCMHLTARLLILGDFTNSCCEIPNLDIIIMGHFKMTTSVRLYCCLQNGGTKSLIMIRIFFGVFMHAAKRAYCFHRVCPNISPAVSAMLRPVGFW